MNEYKNNSRVPDNAEGEDDALLSLLRSAYPAPPHGMTDRIIARIREEGAGENKLLSAADSREKDLRRAGIRRALVRWGALAACVVLVGSVGLKILPAVTKNMNKAADTAMQDAFADEAAADTAEPEAFAEVSGGGYAEANSAGIAVKGDPAEKRAAAPAEKPDAEEADEAAPAAPETPAEAFAEALEEDSADYSASGNMTAAIFADSPADNAAAEEAEEAEEAGAWDGLYLDEDECVVPEEAVEEGLLSVKLFTLNGTTGLPNIEAAEGEIPMMTGAPMNDAQKSREVNALDYYYVRTSCAHAGAFRNSYHDIPDVLIARVGP
ncbi:MAG: hypothetical protein IKX19_00065, partial [Clostridia bacterium]|nr:hypothetical protein [Clostridia bacterium]